MRPTNVTSGKKRFHYSYHLGFADTEVCHKTFIDTLDITNGYLKCIRRRIDRKTGKIKPSKRGKSKINYNKISFKL